MLSDAFLLYLQGAAQSDSSAAQRVIQFAAVLLEMGGAVLIAALFVIASRSSERRGFFTTWTLAWASMALAISAVSARYVLLGLTVDDAPPDSAAPVRALYLLYQAAKFSYWVLIWRGAVEYTASSGRQANRWGWVAAAAGTASVSWFLGSNLIQLLIWQAPVAVLCCVAAARKFFLLAPSQRTMGSTTTAVVLGATAFLWALYFIALGSVDGLFDLSLGPITAPLLAYNSHVDTLMLLVLGYAMLLMFMEDSRRRISDIETRLGTLVTGASDPIFTIDAQQRVIAANRAAEVVFGSGKRIASGAPVSDLVEAAGRDRMRDAITTFTEGTEGSRLVGDDGGWLHGIRNDGTQFTAEFTLSRLFDADVTAVSLVVRDVTGRREQEERRRQASTMEAVRQLAGGLAHDFNNLLTTIVGRSQIVGRTLTPGSPVREDVLQIEQAAASAARLSRGLLALSRREPLNPERLGMDDVIRATEAKIRATVGPGVGCTFSLNACGVHAHVDRARFETALLAIVQNAREAMRDAGSLTIETSSAFLPQQFGANVEAACITVRDTGPGLDAEARAHLFEPFFSTKGDGRGLGLATTWAFVHQSGGTVDLESGRNGTVVRILFPVATRIQDDAPLAASPAAPPSLAIVKEPQPVRRTVLVAEDEASVRRSVRLFLERAGYAVVDAANGAEALDAFERAPDEFGLLLTDVMMPQMGGRELATRVMKLRPALPIVFMSGFLRDPEVLRMVNDRRVRFLAKPFDVDALITMVRGEIEDSRSHVA